MTSLKKFNTLSLDCSAKAITPIGSLPELLDVVGALERDKQPYVWLGGGSNVVFSGDFPGSVLVNRIAGIAEHRISDDVTEFRVGGGENWHQFVLHTNRSGFCGLENLALIPGTVGAAPVQNIGAYGEQVANHIVVVEGWDFEQHCPFRFQSDACAFGYRDSRFKRQPGRYFISHVTFRLSRSRALNVSYGEVAAQHARKPFSHPLELNQFICEVRSKKLPDPEVLPNVGSFFKNPVVSNEVFLTLRTRFPEIPYYPDGVEYVKLAAGWMIDQAGWKGYRAGPVGVHERQALVLVNYGAGTGKDILELAARIQKDIQQKYQILLEIEPVII